MDLGTCDWQIGGDASKLSSTALLVVILPSFPSKKEPGFCGSTYNWQLSHPQ
jgi:hypothetical protein